MPEFFGIIDQWLGNGGGGGGWIVLVDLLSSENTLPTVHIMLNKSTFVA